MLDATAAGVVMDEAGSLVSDSFTSAIGNRRSGRPASTAADCLDAKVKDRHAIPRFFSG